ncbi:restriction endonuclease subunit S, partial [Flavobacterium seoulense]|uniref:restriction endonuclease subunit S n=1 Tax=Flavobacterium seoulense TaxID=1492738 RepID=UPI001363F698
MQKLRDVCRINPKNESLPNTFVYIDLESVVDGYLQKENTILKKEAPSRAQRILFKNDILFQMVRPYQKNNLFFDKNGDYVASTGYAQIRTSENSTFIFQYLHNQKFVDRVIEKCTGTSYPAINSSDLGKIKITIPKLEEQKKIGDFLNLISQRILSQKKII